MNRTTVFVSFLLWKLQLLRIVSPSHFCFFYFSLFVVRTHGTSDTVRVLHSHSYFFFHRALALDLAAKSVCVWCHWFIYRFWIMRNVHWSIHLFRCGFFWSPFLAKMTSDWPEHELWRRWKNRCDGSGLELRAWPNAMAAGNIIFYRISPFSVFGLPEPISVKVPDALKKLLRFSVFTPNRRHCRRCC